MAIWFRTAALAAAICAAAGGASAQSSFPSKAVRILVPYPAGVIECTHLCCRSRRGLIPWWASVLQRVMLCRWKLDWDDLAIVAWKKGGVIA